MKKNREKKDFSVLNLCQSSHAQETRELIQRIGDKWSILIVLVLSEQPTQRARFSELKHGITGISQTMLTSTLRSLERDGILEREVFPEVPPRVEYQLTKLGLSLLEPMQMLAGWTSRNWNNVNKARQRFDNIHKKKT